MWTAMTTVTETVHDGRIETRVVQLIGGGLRTPPLTEADVAQLLHAKDPDDDVTIPTWWDVSRLVAAAVEMLRGQRAADVDAHYYARAALLDLGESEERAAPSTRAEPVATLKAATGRLAAMLTSPAATPVSALRDQVRELLDALHAPAPAH